MFYRHIISVLKKKLSPIIGDNQNSTLRLQHKLQELCCKIKDIFGKILTGLPLYRQINLHLY